MRLLDCRISSQLPFSSSTFWDKSIAGPRWKMLFIWLLPIFAATHAAPVWKAPGLQTISQVCFLVANHSLITLRFQYLVSFLISLTSACVYHFSLNPRFAKSFSPYPLFSSFPFRPMVSKTMSSVGLKKIPLISRRYSKMIWRPFSIESAISK